MIMMRHALAALLILLPATVWGGPAGMAPTPEEAGFDSLVQQYTITQRELAITKANLAALAATIARERAYWTAWVAGDIAKAQPDAHKDAAPKGKGGPNGTP